MAHPYPTGCTPVKEYLGHVGNGTVVAPVIAGINAIGRSMLDVDYDLWANFPLCFLIWVGDLISPIILERNVPGNLDNNKGVTNQSGSFTSASFEYINGKCHQASVIWTAPIAWEIGSKGGLGPMGSSASLTLGPDHRGYTSRP